jgi:RNA polymerase sigma factor (sigma-70 family)
MSITSQTLIERAASGDDEAMRKLVLFCEPFARMQLKRAGVKGADQDDLVQEALIRVFQSLPKFSRRGDGSFRNWLGVICVNLYRTLLRFRASRRELMIERISEELVDVSAELTNFDSTLDAKTIIPILWEWQKQLLSSRDCEVFELLEFQELTTAEVHERTGVSKQNILVIRHRVKKSMREEALRLFGTDTTAKGRKDN